MLVEEYEGDAIIYNHVILNNKNQEPFGLASHFILDDLKNAISTGGVKEVSSMFNGNNRHVTQTAITI